ncbi:MAG TPA: hypothetical protein VHY21_03485, partial [Pseudonocardiaceae bacterium]|nr:hypothetical protein [Pseudonocardiaceae bacterium]
PPSNVIAPFIDHETYASANDSAGHDTNRPSRHRSDCSTCRKTTDARYRRLHRVLSLGDIGSNTDCCYSGTDHWNPSKQWDLIQKFPRARQTAQLLGY